MGQKHGKHMGKHGTHVCFYLRTLEVQSGTHPETLPWQIPAKISSALRANDPLAWSALVMEWKEPCSAAAAASSRRSRARGGAAINSPVDGFCISISRSQLISPPPFRALALLSPPHPPTPRSLVFSLPCFPPPPLPPFSMYLRCRSHKQ